MQTRTYIAKLGIKVVPNEQIEIGWLCLSNSGQE